MFKRLIVFFSFILSFLISDNTLTLTNLDTDAGTVDVYMTNDVAVGGFQFGL